LQSCSDNENNHFEDGLEMLRSGGSEAAVINQEFARALALSNNGIITPDNGEYLVANEIVKFQSQDPSVTEFVSRNPLLTVGFPSLDYFTSEEVLNHKNQIDYWTFLPQDLEGETIEAYDKNGNLTTIASVPDKSKRYCVVKQSEVYYAIIKGSTTYSGNTKPSSIGLFEPDLQVANFDLFNFVNYYNALAVDRGTDFDRIDPNGFFDDDYDGPDITVRGECECSESDIERDCTEGDEMLYRIGSTSYSDTYQYETFFHGPNIEFRKIFAYYDDSIEEVIPVNTGIVIRRHLTTPSFEINKRMYGEWDEEVNGDQMVSHWVEEKKGNGIVLSVKLSPKIKKGDNEISRGEVGVNVDLQDVNYNLGNSLIQYSDEYCGEGRQYKVWFGSEGFFFFEHGSE